MKKVLILLVCAVLIAGCEKKGRFHPNSPHKDCVDELSITLAARNDLRTEIRRLREGQRSYIKKLIAEHAAEIATLKARYQKATLIKPNAEWIEAHGDSLESHQTYNLNLLIANVRNKQKIPAKAVEK